MSDLIETTESESNDNELISETLEETSDELVENDDPLQISFDFTQLSKINVECNDSPYSYQEDKYLVIVNGEIYNQATLLAELKSDNQEFTTESIEEVISLLFEKYNTEMFKQLRGKFSIFIWDSTEQALYGARDSFGIQPLFYSESEEHTIFATEKKSISFMLGNEELNKESLQQYLSFQYVPEPATMTKNIKKIEPGYYFRKEPGKMLELFRYFHATFSSVSLEKNKWIERIQNVLRDSVKAHMSIGGPIGSFLSGGIDSTIIVSLAKEIDPNIKTFSVGFEREGFSEVDVAKETASELGLENISYTISPEEYKEILPKIMWHMGDPLADPACVPLYFVAREAKKHVPIVLSGEGSDELFGGYNIYREPDSLKVFNYIPSIFKGLVKQIATVLPEGVRGKSLLERGTTPLRERYIGNAKMFENKEKQEFLKCFNHAYDYHDITNNLYDTVAEYPLVNQMQYIDIHTWMRGDILLKADRMLAAHSLELRVPFLDKEVFEVAREIPVELKIANGTTKHILREAFNGIIPNHVLDRKKLGFPVPIRHWLKNELNDWAKTLITESETDYILEKQYILNLFDAHCQGKGDYSRKLWTVLIFMQWHQIFIEKKFDYEKLALN